MSYRTQLMRLFQRQFVKKYKYKGSTRVTSWIRYQFNNFSVINLENYIYSQSVGHVRHYFQNRKWATTVQYYIRVENHYSPVESKMRDVREK